MYINPRYAGSAAPLQLSIMQKIVVLNTKGGSGKTTVAINLASHFAAQGLRPTLMDFDPQGSSTRWLKKRKTNQASIYGIAGYEKNPRVTRTFAYRIPAGCQRVIVDTPAALDSQKLPEVTRNANAILVPVLPSDIDIHAATRCISSLLLIAKIARTDQRIGVIANRVKKNTVMYKSLMKFLDSLQIPVVAILRDSQAYIRSAESGEGIFEMNPASVHADLPTWTPLLSWLDERGELPADAPLFPSAAMASRVKQSA